MSEEIRKKPGGERDMNRGVNQSGVPKNYEGFEGMNYEQPRQPFNPKYISRNRSNDERKEGKRPDEG
jgi:hypothetical protein